ncbi:exosortase V [uncultured Sphingomonas sp.]|uniref:exosortase V n=1 Tax=uncultured Sphingomonas sp. TaxID=158754 RepID=UPI0035CB518D
MTVQSRVELPGLAKIVPGWRINWALVPIAVGVLSMVIPTLQRVANKSWSTEQGAHGPIVLAIAIWLFVRRWPAIKRHALLGSPWLGGGTLVGALLGYTAARIVGSEVLEAAACYGALCATLYLFVGMGGIRQAWFPILYFLFVLPPPGSVVAAATQPLRLQISAGAVSLLSMLGLPVAQTGLVIFIEQYTLEVKAACGGLNSLISLSAIGLFYAYIRHSGDAAYMAVMFCAIVVMAVLANFIRVILLVLITYYLGNEAAQGFLHQFAGMAMFVIALLGTMAFDGLLGRLWHRRSIPA